jgi:UDP-3-O-[3-hydroxymyristoyl] glucosamine N-acyltransferase
VREFNRLLKITKGKRPTCSLDNPCSGGITFIKNEKYISKLNELKDVKNLMVLLPKGLKYKSDNSEITLFEVANTDLVFTLYQNRIYKKFDPSKFDLIHETADIHPSAVIGVDGIKVVLDGEKKILFKHTGNVIIEKDVNISANAVIHRARLDSTIIGEGTIIGALTNIAHNVIIGKNCVLATNVSIGGSAVVGDNCWIGMSAVIRNGVRICDNVVIGMGSVVIKDVDSPGFYVGSPAKFLRKFEKGDRGF